MTPRERAVRHASALLARGLLDRRGDTDPEERAQADVLCDQTLDHTEGLGAAFDLDPQEQELLLVAAVLAEEPCLGVALGLLAFQPSRAHLAALWPSAGEAMRTRLAPEARLCAWQLLDDAMRPAPGVAARLFGRPAAREPELAVALRALPERPEPRQDEPWFQKARTLLDGATPRVVGLVGGPGSGRRRAARALVGPALEIRLDLLPREPLPFARAFAAALREARLDGARPVLATAEALDERLLAVCGHVLRQLAWNDHLLLVAERRFPLRPLGDDCVWLEVTPGAVEARTQHLAAALTRAGVAVDGVEAAQAARLYAAAPGVLEAAARDAARGEPIAVAVRRQLHHALSSLADPVVQRHTLDDMVLDEETRARLREMLVYVRHQRQVYEQWGFDRHLPSRGLAALFTGPPGTGKTMAAAVIATELGIELFRVDVSRVVSKYIGETEQNLARVFAEAERSRAALLFDEADSLFGRRAEVRDAHDRYANMEVNFLLARMERFDGVSILTTNHEGAIDPAFFRRLQFRLRFEPPDDELRAELWLKLVPPAAVAPDLDVGELARLFPLTGSTIRNAALRAAFRAAAAGSAITQALLVDAAEVELTEGRRVVAQRRPAHPPRIAAGA